MIAVVIAWGIFVVIAVGLTALFTKGFREWTALIVAFCLFVGLALFVFAIAWAADTLENFYHPKPPQAEKQ